MNQRQHGLSLLGVSVYSVPQAPALKRCAIMALYLGNNAMGDQGVASLADGLSHARGLQILHLNDNEVRQHTYRAITRWRPLWVLPP